MTRYSKLIGFIFFAMVTLGTYGINQIVVGSNKTEAEFVTIEGDDAYLNPVHAKGDIYGNYFMSSSSFDFIDNQFIFPDDKSLFEKLDNTYIATYNKIMDRYRSFARGKYPYAYYSESEDQIVYVDMQRNTDFSDPQNNAILLSVLDKSSEEEKSYTLSPPEDLGGIINLDDVYINFPSIHFTFNTEGQLSVYSLDLEEVTPTFTKVREISQDISTDIDAYPGLDASIDHKYLEIYDAQTTDAIMTVSHLYDYESDQIIPMPSYTDLIEPKVVTNGDQIYMLDGYFEDYKIYEVDSVNDTLEPLTKMQLVPFEENDSNDYVQITPHSIVDGALYSVLSTNNQEIIQVNDIQNGELLYGGSLETTGKYKDQTKANFYDFNINQ